MLTNGSEGKPNSEVGNCNRSGNWKAATSSKKLRTGRNEGTRRSIISLSSMTSNRLTVHTAKSEKPTDDHTRISSGKSSDAFSEIHSQTSLHPPTQDELIKQLEEENERYQRLLSAELTPLQQRYQQLCSDYTAKLTVLDRLQSTLMMLARTRQH